MENADWTKVNWRKFPTFAEISIKSEVTADVKNTTNA